MWDLGPSQIWCLGSRFEVRGNPSNNSEHLVSKLFDKLLTSLRPQAPFSDGAGDKGWMNYFALAQALQITQLDLRIPGWSSRRRHLKIAALADIHLGSHANDISRLAEIVTTVNDWDPDIVLLLGDYVNTQFFGGGRIPPHAIAEVLRSLDSKLGTYAVLGNHDWHYDGYSVWTALEAHGIAVLENTSKKIKDTCGDFWVIGLADEQTRRPDVDAAFASTKDSELALVLAHDPATFFRIPSGPYLTLSGHTHGGQFRLPVIGPIFNSSNAPLKWSSGYVIENGRHLFVSRGLGTSILPMRFNCPPEVCFLTVS